MNATSHLRCSFVLIASFLAMGLVLEALLGLRSSAWLDDELRRELLRLGHAHGGMLGILNLGVAWALERLQTPAAWARRVRAASLGGAVLVGLGFIGGGLWHGPTDPGAMVLVVPAGALLLVCSLIAVAVVRAPSDD